jgi:hypothetical protein
LLLLLLLLQQLMQQHQQQHRQHCRVLLLLLKSGRCQLRMLLRTCCYSCSNSPWPLQAQLQLTTQISLRTTQAASTHQQQQHLQRLLLLVTI